MELPYIISFSRIGEPDKGFLVPYEHIPFAIAHAYCIGPVPENEVRGNHAKKQNRQVLVAIGGEAKLSLEAPSGDIFEFHLKTNYEGLYIPAGYWRSAQLSGHCFLMGFHSIPYTESDYVRNYDEFKKLNNR